MRAPDPRLGEIEARHGGHEGHSDVRYLLAELRKRDEALARVEGLAERWAGLDSSPYARAARLRTLRSAAATGGGDAQE